jgi:hypothetical protein
MIVSVFVRRLKPGASFQDFVREWEADEGFGVPTRVFNAQSLTDPREVISIGFVAVTPEQVAQWLSTAPATEAVRHERIDTVIESTTLRCMYDVRTEHDFSHLPQQIDIGSAASLLAALIYYEQSGSAPGAPGAEGGAVSRDEPPAHSRPS